MLSTSHRFLHFSYTLLAICLSTSGLQAQTDAPIFREFEFDFSTPGARANAMGRAFVGLADEASAAYSNPAGLSVLQSPELTLEGRLNQAFYSAITATGEYEVVQGEFTDSKFELNRLGFASYAFSRWNFNFSAFFVNNLDYRRELSSNTVALQKPEDLLFNVNWRNDQEVPQISLNTTGLSISRQFGKLSLGMSVGMMRLDMAYTYVSNVNNVPLFSNRVRSEADLTGSEASNKLTYVGGAIYQAHPRLKVGFSYKRHPRFKYQESVEFPTPTEVPVTFKVPDSWQLGVASQPNDRWTLLLDLDLTRYRQTLGKNMTIIGDTVVANQNFPFDVEDFTVKEKLNYRFGAEYLQPVGSNILAWRVGAFIDSEHKTRFIGEPESGSNPFEELGLQLAYETQHIIYNGSEDKDNVGYTAGLGFVWRNVLQFDAAYIDSDRYNRAVVSLLYRF